MCGVMACFAAGGVPPEAALQRGLDVMVPRGPDASGAWQDGETWLGHRRLAILDLDARANQPFASSCGRFLTVFNGEIYNFAALRSRLQAGGAVFRTGSDTEVLVELFRAEGAAMLGQLDGMFAFVIWDRRARRAFVARDPYGIKPLYLARTSFGVLVASQVKALMATGLVSREPDPQGQAGFWMMGSVPEPHTWFRDVRALPAGSCLWIADGRVQEERRWHDIGSAWQSAAPANALTDRELRTHVRAGVRESVRRHMVADVPIGVFLSGGVDSSVVAALMAEAGGSTVQGVTVTFDEFSGQHEDEAPVAGEVARHYGLAHHVRRVTRSEFMADMPAILRAMDQPSVDGVNSWYASKAVAERGLKVVMSGVGGDELFLGYASFRQLPRLQRRWASVARLPGIMWMGHALGAMQAARIGNARWRHAANWGRSLAGAWWLRRSMAAPEDLPALMGAELASDAMRAFSAEATVHAMCGTLASDPTLALAQIESMAYLRNQLLRDSDWASMAHSIELRTPLVDARLLAHLMPCLASLHRFPGKSLLADAPERALPPAVTSRRKTGFGIPVQAWLAQGSSRQGPRSPRLSGWSAWMRHIVHAYADSGG